MLRSPSKSSTPPTHLEIQRRDSARPVGLLRTTFRDPKTKKISHHTMGRIVGLPLDKLLELQASMRNTDSKHASKKVLSRSLFDTSALKILRSREFGASKALYELAKGIGLDKLIYSRSEDWVRSSLSMIIGRIIYQGSKLSLSQCSNYSALWEICGINQPIDVNEHCYAAMDRLLSRQKDIQKALIKKHLQANTLILFDITSSYMEGEYEESELIAFGYNRDKKRGYEQIVIGLITNDEGCPVSIEVFPGNTKDESTVEGKVRELRQTYGIGKMILVGDRGMITQNNEKKLRDLASNGELKIISALTHREIADLLKRTSNKPQIFDDKEVIEITDPAEPSRRYCLCRNPKRAEDEGRTRNELLEKTKNELTRVGATALKSQKTKAPTSAERIGSRINKVLAKTKMGKYVEWSVSAPGVLNWQIDQAKVTADQALDGCYVIKSDVSREEMPKEKVVKTYKQLSKVEQAFRNIKTVRLELRPIYHRLDDRIKAHVFLCMLAYHLQWHMMKRLEPLFKKEKQGIEDKNLKIAKSVWTLDNIIEIMKAQREEKMEYQGEAFTKVSEATPEQVELLNLLNINY
jgi:transposase